MKCQSCRAENRAEAARCARCRKTLPSYWEPSWKWISGTLLVLYAVLGIFYIILRRAL